MRLTVARIGRAHGLKGELSVELHTDVPELRLAVGATLDTSPDDAGPLTVESTRIQAGRWYVRFEGVADRSDAEALRGVELVVEAEPSDEDDAWYPYELEGLEARRPDGEVVGTVAGLEHLPAYDLLVVSQQGGHRAMIPFVEAMVPEVNVAGGYVVVTPPYGLLAGEQPEVTGETRS